MVDRTIIFSGSVDFNSGESIYAEKKGEYYSFEIGNGVHNIKVGPINEVQVEQIRSMLAEVIHAQ